MCNTALFLYKKGTGPGPAGSGICGSNIARVSITSDLSACVRGHGPGHMAQDTGHGTHAGAHMAMTCSPALRLAKPRLDQHFVCRSIFLSLSPPSSFSVHTCVCVCVRIWPCAGVTARIYAYATVCVRRLQCVRVCIGCGVYVCACARACVCMRTWRVLSSISHRLNQSTASWGSHGLQVHHARVCVSR